MKERGVKQVRIGVWAILGLFLAASVALAQSRPLATEDPETVPEGNILFEAGFDYAHGAVYPASGLVGNLKRIGTFGFSFGVSPIAEIQLDGGVRNILAITSRNPDAPLANMLEVPGDSTSDFEDLSIGAKVRFADETMTRPSMAIRFSTRLPDASNESGLGMDTTDFHFGFAIGKTVQSVRIVGNFGFGILPDPVRGDRQNDTLEYGLSIARAVKPGVELVGELNGRKNTRNGEPPIGTESRSALRLGARLTERTVRIDGALMLGITEFDPSWGVTGGVTWVFHAFNVR
jgi:hypothetical protein